MADCNFVFDTVVTKFECFHVEIGNSQKLKVLVQFNKKEIPITASRINVTDFPPLSGTEFKVPTQTLRQVLEACGMPFSVSYDNFVLGTGKMSFPQSFIDGIDEGMSDLVHWDSCQFAANGQVKGTLELLCRLIIKCDAQQQSMERDFRCNANASINPQDILFVTNRCQGCHKICDNFLDTQQSEDGDEQLKFDMERFAGPRPIENTHIHKAEGNAACCQLKKMIHCNNFVESLIKSTGIPDLPKTPRQTSEELHPTTVSYLPERQYEINDCCSSKLLTIKPIRFCPICLTNMSWLPKFAACPKCGTKFMPFVEEENQTIPAEQIVKDYMVNTSTIIDDKKTSKEILTRCRCSGNTLCAHCRIRKQCADFLQLQPMAQESKVVDQPSADYCINSVDSRPHLARVFSELRDAYTEQKGQQYPALKKPCDERLTHKTKSSKAHLPDIKRKTNTIDQVARLTETKRHISSVHKSCVKAQQRRVSRRHGWNWSDSKEARKYGWRPGAIFRPIKKIMNFFLYPPKDNAYAICRALKEVELQNKYQLPILNVCKKNGNIFITLRAVNNPNVQMKPIVFKIAKTELAIALSEIKKKLKEKGFPKCTCHKTLMMCVCRNHVEKKRLESALQKECEHRGMENCVDHLVLTDTSDSEMEYDFDVSPPAGSTKHPLQVKPILVNHATQTSRKHRLVPPSYPIKHSPFWRTYDCAAGDRYTSTAFGEPGEAVFEDGVFGNRGGGPHGAYATPGADPKTKIFGVPPLEGLCMVPDDFLTEIRKAQMASLSRFP
ncbi:uncharacterized protein LOC116806081 [Drosophila grimshawi]|uniref:uncharacterized protein LOC116806081 n=1 Tax=Drosophila grimshawi TaxID=7222 RepID=UPI001C934748|nr:uncharacterized protein LOC116806081 [Drosophila grimshawi]